MTRHMRGAANTNLIFGVLILAIGTFGVLYFASDVFRTKTDATIRDMTEWTPENIAADPVNYLNFAEKQTQSTLQKLKANEISVNQQMAKLKSMQSEHQETIELGDKALNEVKTLYRDASAKQSWPVKFREKELDETMTKRQILNLAGQIDGKKKVLKTIATGIKKLEAQRSKISDARNQCQQQLAQIQTNRSMLEVQSITDDLKKQLVEMKGVLVSTTAVASADSDDLVSLDQLADDSAGSVDEAKFDEIMKR